MKPLKFKTIKKYEEDVIGFFARQPYYHFQKSKVSTSLILKLKRNSTYKKLIWDYKVNFFQKKKNKIDKLNKPYQKRNFFYWKWFKKFRKKKIRLWWSKPFLYRNHDNTVINMKNTWRIDRIKKKKARKLKQEIASWGLDYVYELRKIIPKKKQQVLLKRKKRRNIKTDLYFMRKKLKKFYEFKTLKKFMFLLYSNKYSNKYLGYSYTYLLEARLEMILYRSNFFISILEARQAIIHKHVLVNGKIINKAHYLVNIGDIIMLKNYKQNLIKYKILANKLTAKQILINYPSYLEVNYKLFSIILIKNPVSNEISFPFLLNLDLMKYNSIL